MKVNGVSTQPQTLVNSCVSECGYFAFREITYYIYRVYVTRQSNNISAESIVFTLHGIT